MSDADRIATLEEALRTVSDSEHELRSQVTALNRSLALAEKREQAAKDKLERRNKEAPEADAVRRCLDVWEKHCWAGKAKPKSGPTGPRIARIRKAFEWGFEELDICDALRGLGLLAYRNKFNERRATLQPGFYRAADVKEALCEEARVERFRDYYRRVQASPADRHREQAHHTFTVARNLLDLAAAHDRMDRYSAQRVWRSAGEVPVWMSDAMFRVLARLLGTRVMDTELQTVALTCALAAEHAYYEREYRDMHPDAPPAVPEPTTSRPSLFVIEGEAA